MTEYIIFPLDVDNTSADIHHCWIFQFFSISWKFFHNSFFRKSVPLDEDVVVSFIRSLHIYAVLNGNTK